MLKEHGFSVAHVEKTNGGDNADLSGLRSLMHNILSALVHLLNAREMLQLFWFICSTDEHVHASAR